MTVKNKQYKKLYKQYYKKFKCFSKKGFNQNAENFIDLFVDFLRFKRDCLILTEPLEIDGKENYSITALANTISYYEQYKALPSTLELLAASTETDPMKVFIENKVSVWETFWNMVAINLESWSIKDDSI